MGTYRNDGFRVGLLLCLSLASWACSQPQPVFDPNNVVAQTRTSDISFRAIFEKQVFETLNKGQATAQIPLSITPESRFQQSGDTLLVWGREGFSGLDVYDVHGAKSTIPLEVGMSPFFIERTLDGYLSGYSQGDQLVFERFDATGKKIKADLHTQPTQRLLNAADKMLVCFIDKELYVWAPFHGVVVVLGTDGAIQNTLVASQKTYTRFDNDATGEFMELQGGDPAALKACATKLAGAVIGVTPIALLEVKGEPVCVYNLSSIDPANRAYLRWEVVFEKLDGTVARVFPGVNTRGRWQNNLMMTHLDVDAKKTYHLEPL